VAASAITNQTNNVARPQLSAISSAEALRPAANRPVLAFQQDLPQARQQTCAATAPKFAALLVLRLLAAPQAPFATM